MEIIETVYALDRFLRPFRDEGKSIGLVPTMGSLHEGHVALVKQCVGANDVSVVSVFVNPTQFNDKEDFRLYPCNSEADCKLLESLGVTVAFVPSVEEMYPEPDTRVFDFGMLDKVMEGRFRPGHFNGVAQIVSKLFYAVKPSRAYFGEKDFQQLAIVRDMVRQLAIPVEIVGVPIVREESGLALSSRNLRLSDEQRQKAAEIYRSLRFSADFVGKKSIQETIDFVTNRINQIESLRVEYFDIVDGNTLQSVSDWNESAYIVGCIAVFCGDVRLIDNISYKN
ncbi:MAG: pantoate--beta-alanine ligase [Bacteroidales bacterium]|jgi:pantoate--beta-alanine ligase|nr:pantoate--beta-alanine ligase [Bacteroidales bacterium]